MTNWTKEIMPVLLFVFVFFSLICYHDHLLTSFYFFSLFIHLLYLFSFTLPSSSFHHHHYPSFSCPSPLTHHHPGLFSSSPLTHQNHSLFSLSPPSPSFLFLSLTTNTSLSSPLFSSPLTHPNPSLCSLSILNIVFTPFFPLTDKPFLTCLCYLL